MVLLVPVSIYSIFVATDRSSSVYYFGIHNYNSEQKIKHGLARYGSNTGCEDTSGQEYSENTTLEFQNSLHKFYYICDRRVLNEHSWTIRKTKYLNINPTIITTDTNGCTDNFNRNYPVGYEFTEEIKYTCTNIKDKYFWLIKK
jgi:hypothetical protein